MEFHYYKDVFRNVALGSMSHENTAFALHFKARTFCYCCSTQLESWLARRKSYGDFDDPHLHDLFSELKLCRRCGWWTLTQHDLGGTAWRFYSAILKKFNIQDDDAPLAEVKRVLAADWKYSKYISAQRAEDLVSSVYKNSLDCEVEYLTNGVFSKDKGIDFVLVSKNGGEKFAFQVKRRQNEKSERVQEIRAFIGALAISSYDFGYYVTTADNFSADVLSMLEQSPSKLAQRKLLLRCVDGKTLRRLCELQTSEPETLVKLKNMNIIKENWWRCSPLLTRFEDIPESGGSDFTAVLADLL